MSLLQGRGRVQSDPFTSRNPFTDAQLYDCRVAVPNF